MKEKETPTPTLEDGVKKFYNLKVLVIKILSGLVAVSVLGLLIFLIATPSDVDPDRGTIIGTTLFFLFVAAMFAAIFWIFKRQKNNSLEKLRYFTADPESLVSYIIVDGLTKLVLKGKDGEVTISLALTALEIEKAVFEAFPLMKPRNPSTEELSEPEPHIKPKVERAVLRKAIPDALGSYFSGKPSSVVRLSRMIFGIAVSISILSIISSLGWVEFWFFKEGNYVWGYMIMPLLIFGFISLTDSEDKKIGALLNVHPDKIVWAYIERTKTTATSSMVVIADEKEKYLISVTGNEAEETLLWLSLYCPSAIIGFRYEWDEIYKNDPRELRRLAGGKN